MSDGEIVLLRCVALSRSHNEMPHGNAHGELKRIGRLVEFENEEVWVLDYETGASHDPAPYSQQPKVLP